MKPRSTWLITALCLALLCGAMAWTTRSMLHMEANQDRMANEASVQEMARLALWRMESIASGLVITESARPPEQYCTFTVPQALLDNKTLESVNEGDVVALSPLLREPPDFLKLHFEMDASGALRSPQVPADKDLAVCQAIHTPSEESLTESRQSLAQLRQCVDSTAAGAPLIEMRGKLGVPATLSGNRAVIWSANSAPVPVPPLPAPVRNPGAANDATPPAETMPAKDEVRAQAPAKPAAPPAQNAYASQQRAFKPEEAQAQQLDFNNLEAKARQDIVKSGLDKAASRRVSNYDNAAGKMLATKSDDAAKTEADVFSKSTAPPPAAAAATASPPVLSQPPPEAAAIKELLPAPAAAPAPAGPRESAPDISDFRPLWLGEALLLTRRVSTADREWIQGAWLDWDKLRAELLTTVQDLFPSASVVPARETTEPGAHLLASLPVQLIPGAVSFAAPPFWSPLKVSLSIAWLCVLLAIAAVALVLRGMMSLSERRASFVSSVTHELRTPLATFKLYSEMLADGMVREEAKKQQYLETLTTEADRLGHLVENVLAYSRIERGKGPTAAASVRAGELVHRIEPQLNQRTLLAGMDFDLIAAPDALETPLRTDAGAVEQILCNLTDNACKYGRHDGAPGKVELVVTRERRRITFAVRDYGPGIPRHEQNTIFLPFHKSARDAAHSAPGVGLGLALCRRLAAELRGTLEMDRTWKHGACFVLRLPV